MSEKCTGARTNLLLVSVETIKNQEDDVVGFYCVQKDVSADNKPLQNNQLLISQLEVLKKLAGAFTVARRPGDAHFVFPKEVRTLFHLREDKQEWTIEEIGEFVFKGDAPGVAKQIARAVRSGEPVDVEFRVVGDDHKTRWVRCHSVASKHDRPGELPHSWSILDVTLYRAQMTNLNNHLELRNHQLTQVNRSLTEFAYALSHDLRRPVRHVSSFADLLKEALQSADHSSALNYLDRIQHAATNMANLIDRMLSFSQVGYRSLEYVEINQHELISELMNQVCMPQSGYAVKWSIKDKLPPAFADRVLWQTMWQNLIDNAIKYSRDCEVIEIEFSAEQVDNQCCYRIMDNGIGFNPDGATRMFEIFQRLHSDERFEGSGIGLAQARRIMEAHGGTIFANSQPGCGATFCVMLPILGPHGVTS